jgi:hypothetical protein
VLLLVGTFEVFDSARAGESGAVGHLKKPFDSQELLRRVQELLASSRPAAAAEAAPATEPAAGEPVFEPISDEDAARAASWSFEPVGEAPAEEAATAAAEEIWGGPAPAEPQPFEPPPIELPHPLAGSARAAEPAAAAPAPELFVQAAGGRPLSEEEVDRIARRVIELGGERIVRDIAWEVVPDLAEVLLKARIRELEASVE